VSPRVHAVFSPAKTAATSLSKRTSATYRLPRILKNLTLIGKHLRFLFAFLVFSS
jgi:hypothetical protein